MKTKIVLWGKDSSAARTLIALQLHPDTNKIKTWVFSGELATEELGNQLLFDWREDKEEFTIPEGAQVSETDLTVTGTLLPEGVTADKPDILQRAQTEWHFMVLSSKLNQSYSGELDDFAERISQLTAYDHKIWEELKTFWDKVREQKQERNLFKEHANQLSNRTNEMFGKLKEFRAALDAEFKAAAQANYDRFSEKLADIEARAEKNINLSGAFDELKRIQHDFKNAKLTRDLRNELWKRIDKSFKLVKEKRFGAQANQNNNPTDRLTRRYEGLLGAITKMQNSIKRDEDDLAFQERKINSVYTGQLESQIRQAKIKMIQERINSKTAKLEEMLKTKVELEDKMEQVRERAEKRKAQEEARKKAEAEKAAKAAAKKAEAKEETKMPKAEENKTEVEAPATKEKAATEMPAIEEQSNEAAPEAPTSDKE